MLSSVPFPRGRIGRNRALEPWGGLGRAGTAGADSWSGAWCSSPSSHPTRGGTTRRPWTSCLPSLANRPFTRALLMEYRSSMEDLAPSTVNVRLAAVRTMVTEAKRNGLLASEEAASLTNVPNVRQQGTRLGNGLTKEQARELLAVPDRSTVKGKRDYAILALLVGCALRRRELASLTVEDIQMRENRWVIADLCGKSGRFGQWRSRCGSSTASMGSLHQTSKIVR